MKNLCVLGVLLTDRGKEIKNEMLSWLNNDYDVLCIEQNPPGEMFEYPAIKAAIKLSIEMNEPVLYIHTKGAAHDYIWERTIRNNQTEIRKFWKREFTVNKNAYFNYPIDSCLVTTPMLEDDGKTIFNAFVIYPEAAKALLPSYHLDKDRFYYEDLFSKISAINLIGVVKHRTPEIEIRKYIENGDFNE